MEDFSEALREFAERGADGTLRYYVLREEREYVATICSYEPCSRRFTSPKAEKARFCSPACRNRAYRAAEAEEVPKQGAA